MDSFGTFGQMLSKCRTMTKISRDASFVFLSTYFTCKEFDRVSPGLAIAASIEVVVVPMFDPSVRG